MVDLAQTITEWKDVEGNKVRQCEPNNNKKLAQLYKAEVDKRNEKADPKLKGSSIFCTHISFGVKWHIT